MTFRASGTEPLIRCYIEAKTKAGLKKLQTSLSRFACSVIQPGWCEFVNGKRQLAYTINRR
jgi:hypothetical protein